MVVGTFPCCKLKRGKHNRNLYVYNLAVCRHPICCTTDFETRPQFLTKRASPDAKLVYSKGWSTTVCLTPVQGSSGVEYISSRLANWTRTLRNCRWSGKLWIAVGPAPLNSTRAFYYTWRLQQEDTVYNACDPNQELRFGCSAVWSIYCMPPMVD